MMLGRKWDVWLALAIGVVTFALLVPYVDASMPSIRDTTTVGMGDEGTVLSNADRVSRGDALYREVFDFKGPIGYLPYVVAYKFATPTVRTARLVMFGILACWAAATFAVSRRITGSRGLGAVAALLVPLQVWQAWSYAYQDFTAQLFLTLAVLCALKSPEARQTATGLILPAGLWLGAAGACAALAFWTSLAQGLTVMVGLGVSIAAVEVISAGRSAAARSVVAYALGIIASTLAVVAWLLAMGAVSAGLQAMFVFPFKHYAGTNVTEYAFDASLYPERWMGTPWVYHSVRLMVEATRFIPFLALGVALPVAVWLVALVVRPKLRRWPASALVRAGMPASLAAAAVPVVLNKTRSDICHIGFIEGGCILAMLAVFAVRPLGAWGARLARIVRWAVALSLCGLLSAASAFYVHALRLRAPTAMDLDALWRTRTLADAIEARTRPEDRILVTPYGGEHYLYSRRQNATSFALLFEDPYCAGQWPVAARQVVENRPRLLLIPQAHFDKLKSYQPSLGSMYFGYNYNFMLDERGSGPNFPLPARWEFVRENAARFEVRLELDQGNSKLLADIVGGPQRIRAAIQGDLLSVFDDERSYVGRLSPDGSSVRGTQFGPRGQKRSFHGRSLEP